MNTLLPMHIFALIFIIHTSYADDGKISFGDESCEALQAKFDNMNCSAKAMPSTRIIGGRRAQAEESKFMVHIGYNKGEKIYYYCGGSLIHERWTLSAAHCAMEKISGMPDLVKLRSNEVIAIEWVIRHPKFTNKASYNDILLLRLKTPVNFDCDIQPVCLFTRPVVQTEMASILGWGQTGSDSGLSKHLMIANVQVFNNTFCNKLYASLINSSIGGRIAKGIAEDQICAGTLSGEKDACLGDSGGPLVILKKNVSLRTQLGITSFGFGCGSPGYPGIYARVSHFIPWIEWVVNKIP